MSEKTLKWMGCSAGILLAMATLWFFVLLPVLKELGDKGNKNEPFSEAYFEAELFDNNQDWQHLDAFIADQEYLAQTGLFPPTVLVERRESRERSFQQNSTDLGERASRQYRWL